MSDQPNIGKTNSASSAQAIAAQPDTKEPGTRIADRYVLRNVIGHGNTSIIYLAHDEISQNEIALKLIPADHLPTQFSYEQFRERCLNVATMTHPNIVKIYNSGRHEYDLFVAMERISGFSLRHFIWEKMSLRAAIPAAVAARIVDETLNGLATAHASGLHNLDLRPSKILLLAEPTASSARLKIVDFGITAHATQNCKLVNNGHYLAPEMRVGTANGTAASDIYSLSVIFYELLTALLPYGIWQPPSQGRQDVPRKLDNLIYRGLSAAASLRPKSAEAFRTDLLPLIGAKVELGNIETLRRLLSKWLRGKPPH